MSDKLKTQLDAIFDVHSATKQKVQQQRSEREAREEAFVQSFNALQDATIRPTFERIGEYVKGRGYDYRIETNQESSHHDGRYRPPSVVIRFLLSDSAGRYRDHEDPHFSVILEKSQGKVRFHRSTMSPGRGGMSGSVGEATLVEVTPELLQSKLLELLREVFK